MIKEILKNHYYDLDKINKKINTFYDDILLYNNTIKIKKILI